MYVNPSIMLIQLFILKTRMQIYSGKYYYKYCCGINALT